MFAEREKPTDTFQPKTPLRAELIVGRKQQPGTAATLKREETEGQPERSWNTHDLQVTRPNDRQFVRNDLSFLRANAEVWVLRRAGSKNGAFRVDHVSLRGVIHLNGTGDEFRLCPPHVHVLLRSGSAVNDALPRLKIIPHLPCGELLTAVTEFRQSGGAAGAVRQRFGVHDVRSVIQHDVVGLQIDLLILDAGIAVEVNLLVHEINSHAVLRRVVYRGFQTVLTH